MNTDLKGEKALKISLMRIKGIGKNLANILCRVANLNPLMKAGALTDDQIKMIEGKIKTISDHIPTWLLNRQKDYETGEDGHLLTADLDFTQANDIKRMKMIKCYKGVRHSKGLPVRGQKTKSNFRRNKGKGSLGVKRKKGAKSGKN